MNNLTVDPTALRLGQQIDQVIQDFVKENDITYDTVIGILFHRATELSNEAQKLTYANN